MSVVVVLQFLGKLLRNAENLSSLFVGPFCWLFMNSPLVEYHCLLDISLRASSLYTT